MSSVAARLSKFLESAFKRAFDREKNNDTVDLVISDNSSFLYETIEEYRDAGYHFRRTKDQMNRGLTREEAFDEFKKNKKNP